MRTYYRKDGNTAVGNSCADQLDCSFSQEFCEIWEDNDGDVSCKIGCCTSDLCNAGSPPSFSIFLVTVCSALGRAILMQAAYKVSFMCDVFIAQLHDLWIRTTNNFNHYTRKRCFQYCLVIVLRFSEIRKELQLKKVVNTEQLCCRF